MAKSFKYLRFWRGGATSSFFRLPGCQAAEASGARRSCGLLWLARPAPHSLSTCILDQSLAHAPSLQYLTAKNTFHQSTRILFHQCDLVPKPSQPSPRSHHHSPHDLFPKPIPSAVERPHGTTIILIPSSLQRCASPSSQRRISPSPSHCPSSPAQQTTHLPRANPARLNPPTAASSSISAGLLSFQRKKMTKRPRMGRSRRAGWQRATTMG